METHSQSDSVSHVIVLLVLTLVLAFGHMIYNLYFGYRLFELRGGVQKMSNGWTSLDGIDKAWTSPIHLPGCLVMDLGYKLYRHDHPRYDYPYPPQPYSCIGGLLVIAGSMVAGFVATSIILAALHRQKPILGRCLWRLWLVILTWGWVLVPFEASFVYQWTVRY
jgi:hypothetical protein